MMIIKFKKVNNFILLMIVQILIGFQFTNAQDTTVQKARDKNIITSVWNDFKYVSVKTFSIREHQTWKVLTYAGITAALLYANDDAMNQELAREKESYAFGLTKYGRDIGNIYDKPGSAYFISGLFGTLYGSGLIFKNDKLKQTTLLMAESLIFSGILNSSLKVIIGRERPYVNHDPFNFKPFSFDPDYMSMPSGHTSSIFAMMTVLAKQYDAWYVDIPAYTFSVCVAIQRINDDKHWSSDVFIGGTLGYLVGSYVVKRYRLKRGEISVQPELGANGIGLNILF